jgi:hypothetical protein
MSTGIGIGFWPKRKCPLCGLPIALHRERRSCLADYAIDHIDSDPINNDLDNLRVVKISENLRSDLNVEEEE